MPNFISTKVPITEKSVKLLYDTGYTNVVQISLDSLNDQILNKIIGTGPGYVEQMKHTIKLLVQYGFKVQIDTILTNLNSDRNCIDELYTYIRTISNLVYWELRVPEFSIYKPILFKQIQGSKKQITEIGDYITKDIIPQADFEIRYSDRVLKQGFCDGQASAEYFEGGLCGILQNELFILPDGKVSVCEQLYWLPQFVIGDLTHQTIEEVWNSKKALELFNMKKTMFRESSKCRNCKNFDFCNSKHRRCFVKVIKAYGPENWDYPDPRCIYAPEVKSGLIYR